MDRSTRWKANKETQALKEALDQRDFIVIYRTFHPKATKYTFFSSAHGTFSKIDHILGYKSNLSTLRKLKSYQASFPTTTLYDSKATTRKTPQKTQTRADSTTCYSTTKGSLKNSKRKLKNT